VVVSLGIDNFAPFFATEFVLGGERL